MSRSGADLALLLLGGFRSLADAASVELAERGHEKIRPVHDFAIRSIDAGADTASELGRQLGVSKQAAAKTIGFLEERGYITGEADQRDPRRRRFTVTPEGHALISASDRVAAAWATTGKRPQTAMRVRDPSARAAGSGVGVGLRFDRSARKTTQQAVVPWSWRRAGASRSAGRDPHSCPRGHRKSRPA